jgi:hypothetical protein
VDIHPGYYNLIIDIRANSTISVKEESPADISIVIGAALDSPKPRKRIRELRAVLR